MSDTKLPDHEEIERYVGEMPKSVIDRLPSSIESREAHRLIIEAEKLAHRAREKVRDE